MKLTVLADNNTFIDQYFLGEPAFSCLLEDGDFSLLLDTGYSDVFLKNADKLGLDLTKVSAVVLSHGHEDHTGGLPFLLERCGEKRPRIVAHPLALEENHFDSGAAIGLTMDPAELRRRAELTLTREPTRLSEHLVFLGEIPAQLPFEARYPIGRTGARGDLLFDDTAICYETPEGLWLITGCSHSGICSIAEHAKKVCGDDRIRGILGGLHLLKFDDRAMSTIDYLDVQDLEALYACHCTCLEVKARMFGRLPILETGSGLTLNL
jgi:7,8-dihydropterin-6-yl-methyl-4-(beta-D-ribofuranosyl)aminobenzene 5'-phosphate synthase